MMTRPDDAPAGASIAEKQRIKPADAAIRARGRVARDPPNLPGHRTCDIQPSEGGSAFA